MTIIFPVTNWLPDQAPLDGTGTIEALNVIPRARGFGPFASFVPVTALSALTTHAQGGFSARKSDGTVVVFVGDATSLYQISGGTWANVSGGTYACPPQGRWQFVQFGAEVLAFNGSDPPQKLNIDSESLFTPLGGSSPTALYATVVGDFVMTGNQNASPNLVQWSAINNCLDWVASQQTQSDSQLLPDGGPVRAIVGYNYSAIILQEFGVKIGTYEGPALIFRFSKIAEGLGCAITGSAAAYRDWCFFYSHNGLYMLQAASQLTPIGEQRVNKWLAANINQTYLYRCCSGIDPVAGNYVFGFPDQTSTGPINHLLIYNYLLDQFTHVQGGNFDWLMSGKVQAAIPSLANPVFGGFDTGGHLGYFTGSPLAAMVTAGELNLVNGKKAFVRGVRPLIEGQSPPAISVALGTRDLQTNPIVYGAPVPMDQFGYCRFRRKGRYHSGQIQLAAGGAWDYILGLTDPLIAPFGTR